MYAYISVKNLSKYPVITLYVNDILYFKDLLIESPYKPCIAGSVEIKVLDNREKIFLNLYLAANPRNKYLLEIHSNGYIFKPVGTS